MRSAALGLLLLGGVLLPPDSAGAIRPEPDPAVGEAAYREHCARCHGATGAGDGRDALKMLPRPRPLSEGVFKFRTTASGTPPTDEDLFQTISQGLPGSRMPDFQRLSEETRWQLVEYVKRLSPAFSEPKPEPIDLGTDPGPARATPPPLGDSPLDKESRGGLPTEGRQVPASGGVPPRGGGANLARGKELYAQLGCNACHGNLGRGNGPSASTLTDQWGNPIVAADLTQGWAYRGGSSPRDVLTRLITGLDGTPMPSYAEAVSPEEVWDLAYYVHSLQEPPQWGRAIRGVHSAGPLPESADDPAWSALPRTDLRLAGTTYRNGRYLSTSVTAISVQALYNEAEAVFRLQWHDRTQSREIPPDAVAVVLLPNLRMKWQIGSLRSLPAAPSIPNLYICRWSAEDGLGPGGAAAKASYEDGKWTVLLRLSLAGLETDKDVPFGVMVWDGGNQEQGRHRANSRWVSLILK